MEKTFYTMSKTILSHFSSVKKRAFGMKPILKIQIPYEFFCHVNQRFRFRGLYISRYERSDSSESIHVAFGPITTSVREIVISIQASLVTFPINFLVVFLVKYSATRRQWNERRRDETIKPPIVPNRAKPSKFYPQKVLI